MRANVIRAAWLLIALLAIRLLPRALRREARALELITLLFQVAASAATANTAKAYATETRVGTLETRAGTIETNVTTAQTTANAAQATANAALPASGGAVSGNVTVSGTLYVSGGFTAGGAITTHANFSGASTTGDGGQGSILGDEFTTTIPGGGAFTASAAVWLNNLQAAHNAHVSDTQSTINRVNDILSAIG